MLKHSYTIKYITNINIIWIIVYMNTIGYILDSKPNPDNITNQPKP